MHPTRPLTRGLVGSLITLCQLTIGRITRRKPEDVAGKLHRACSNSRTALLDCLAPGDPKPYGRPQVAKLPVENGWASVDILADSQTRNGTEDALREERGYTRATTCT